MAFEKFWFKPEHQPNPEKPVEFELKPLDQRGYFRLAISLANNRGSFGFDALAETFLNNATSFKGLDLDCNSKVKNEILSGQADDKWPVWLVEIAAALMVRCSEKTAA